MRLTNVKIGIAAMLYLAGTACKQETKLLPGQSAKSKDPKLRVDLACTAQAEQTDYSIYKMCNDGYRVGDFFPYYDASTGNFIAYFLKDIWSDPVNKRHPVYAFTTNNFYNYAETGELLSCSSAACAQDFAIGTGSVIKSGSTYYMFYTGANPNSGCTAPNEGIMLATSTNPTSAYTKNTSFTTIYAPTGQGFDETDNFRDPYVFLDGTTYYMLVTARKNVSGTWRGVIAKYTSTNLLNWTYQGIMYDGGSTNFFNMECSQEIKIGSTYYLLFSDQGSRYVYYRKSSSVNGPWSVPSAFGRFEGKEMYASKMLKDNYGDHYIFGWNNIRTGNTDAGATTWGGNLVVHKLYQKSNGDLAVTIPHTLQSSLNTNNYNIVKNSQWGNVTNTVPGTHSYRIISPASLNVANVIFEPVAQQRYKISATVNYASSGKDFGFMIGACDGYNDLYSLRFVPSQNRFSFDKTPHGSITTSTVATNDVPFTLSPNTDYYIEIVIENSVVVVYINNVAALSCRIYKAQTTNWGIFTDNSDVTFKNIQVKYQ